MNLRNKKKLASKVLGVGKKRIAFDNSRLEDIQEAITRQDIRDLKEDGAIRIKEKKGRKKKPKRKTKRREGKRKKKPDRRKRKYIDTVRKQRRFLKKMKDKGEISREKYYKLRDQIKARKFEDLKHLKGAV